jgi:hypothetical protein
MSPLARSFAFALAHALHPRMLWLAIWPTLAALLLWGLLVYAFWMRAARGLAQTIGGVLERTGLAFVLVPADLPLFLAHALLALLVVPLVAFTALFLFGLFGMTAVVEYVAATRFAALARRGGGSAAGSLGNAVVAAAGMLALAVLSLPLWIFPPLWPLIPLAISAWGNQRLLRYDALAEHADRQELRALFRAHRGRLYALGFVLALLAYVPLIGFVVPAIGALAFSHFLLSELAGLRAASASGGAR